ncbi:DUF504 domain-containing protein [Candidatus Bathyarchaeota archaeon]|nr:DUF504 domain-containing protein [Candidatus Bathyarchaeota archaeon]
MNKKNPLKEVFEKIFWGMKETDRKDIVIIIIHRGAYQDRKNIPINRVSDFDNYYMYVSKNESDADFSYSDKIPVPFHRILKIVKSSTGEILYQNESHP